MDLRDCLVPIGKTIHNPRRPRRRPVTQREDPAITTAHREIRFIQRAPLGPQVQ
jgi:hypothetical protein